MNHRFAQVYTWMNGADCGRGGFSVAKLIIAFGLVYSRGICMK